ncbi:hypothetical protein F2Q69_00023865 [Brassica cretica]|uniref:Photosystem I reaction center subunit III n=1 Tax=Brassica cretica TaxID=69181 RepID=A0A8S9QCS7_BRACR|nr:hypothetical protein F2Q69_00023865 [Brassica cretica]
MDRAQTEAVNLLCGAKTKSNPENTVGMLTMVGLDVGEFNLTTAIQIAQLAFKHCQNKNQRERIIVFAGRFNNYGKYGLLCGADGIPHLMVNGDQRHWGEFITPGLLFLYIAGWIGWAQTEAVNLLCGAKTQSNPENTVGILTMAGLDVGEFNLTTAIQIAQLAFKHCQKKNQRERIIVFAGSEEQDTSGLVRLGFDSVHNLTTYNEKLFIFGAYRDDSDVSVLSFLCPLAYILALVISSEVVLDTYRQPRQHYTNVEFMMELCRGKSKL